MRVYVIARGYQAAEIDTAEAARRFAAWLTDDANPALTELIQRWLWQPPDAGGLGALAGSVWDVAVLRAEFTAATDRGLAAERRLATDRRRASDRGLATGREPAAGRERAPDPRPPAEGEPPSGPGLSGNMAGGPEQGPADGQVQR